MLALVQYCIHNKGQADNINVTQGAAVPGQVIAVFLPFFFCTDSSLINTEKKKKKVTSALSYLLSVLSFKQWFYLEKVRVFLGGLQHLFYFTCSRHLGQNVHSKPNCNAQQTDKSVLSICGATTGAEHVSVPQMWSARALQNVLSQFLNQQSI